MRILLIVSFGRDEMTQKTNKKNVVLLVIIGLAIGGALGIVFNNILLGLVLGLCLGMSFSATQNKSIK